MLKNPEGRSTAYDKSRGFDSFTSPLWDLTLSPKTNDRRAKLGASAEGMRGVAISGIDQESKDTILGYGFRAAMSVGRFEPDNYVFLDHGGIDKVWAHRDIVDHENGAWTAAHRSDPVTNQKKKMCWGYKQDLMWLVEIQDVGAAVPKSRNFNGAGFLSSLYSNGKAPRGNFARKGLSGATFIFPNRTAKGFEFAPVETKSNAKAIRAVLAFNLNQRGGYMTDGLHVTQFHHFGYMMPVPKPPPKPRFVPVETPGGDASYHSTPYKPGGATYNPNDPQNKALEPGGETPAGQNRPVHELQQSINAAVPKFEQSGGPDSDCMVDDWVGAIRPDAWWDVEGKAAQFAFVDDKPPRGDDLYEGAFIVTSPNPRHPKFKPAEDMSSDQPILPHPDAPFGLRPAVWIPRQTGTPPPCEVQPHFDPLLPAYGTSGVVPPAHTGGGADAGQWRPPLPLVDRTMAAYEFQQGYLTYVMDRAPIPSTFVDMRVIFEVPYSIPTNLTGSQQMDFRFFYKIVTGPGGTAGDTWTEIKKSITAGDNPSSTSQIKTLRFEIDRLGLGQIQGGGSIHYWFMRRSDDSATSKSFRVVGNIQYSFVPVASRRLLTSRSLA